MIDYVEIPSHHILLSKVVIEGEAFFDTMVHRHAFRTVGDEVKFNDTLNHMIAIYLRIILVNAFRKNLNII